jgi:sulfhydrogenase subunit beta (sulfur reductase)
MDQTYHISEAQWESALIRISTNFRVYAPVVFNGSQDYELIDSGNAGTIIYNQPKPSTPVKTFFLPVRENVTEGLKDLGIALIMGVPSCDLAALDVLDEMYLDPEYTDIYYSTRRKNSILAGYDCHSLMENCHCKAYGIDPWPGKNSDLTITRLDKGIFIRFLSKKGLIIKKELEKHTTLEEASENDLIRIHELRSGIADSLIQKTRKLPGFELSGSLIKESNETTWESYSSTCVSCGACATICPTCTCFLLIDRPDFEKIRQLDACQYPGFERVAAGEDPLAVLPLRFKNRYMCKYVWKPLKFKSLTCTGCGRCIDACIGKINKNELLEELAFEHSITDAHP